MKKSFKKQGAIELAVGQDGCSVEVFLNGQWIAQMVKDDVWKSILFGECSSPWPYAIWCGREWPSENWRMASDAYWERWENFSEEELREAEASGRREEKFKKILPKVKEMIWKREGLETLPDWIRELIPERSFWWLSYK